MSVVNQILFSLSASVYSADAPVPSPQRRRGVPLPPHPRRPPRPQALPALQAAAAAEPAGPASRERNC